MDATTKDGEDNIVVRWLNKSEPFVFGKVAGLP